MRALALGLTLALVFTAAAQARHHHGHWRFPRQGYTIGAEPWAGTAGRVETTGQAGRGNALGLVSYTDEHLGTRALVPADWHPLPADAAWDGKRFAAPDGQSWIAVYAREQGDESLAAHIKAVAFVDGEEITALQAGRDWIMVSGRKGDRLFYRRAVFDCGAKVWHHIAFEYPAGLQHSYETLLGAVARSLAPPAGAQDCKRPQAQTDASARE